MEIDSLYWTIIFLSMLCIIKSNTTETESLADVWQPIYKSNNTKEWKAPTVQDAKWREPSYVPSFNRREQVVAVYPSSSSPFAPPHSAAYSKIALTSSPVPIPTSLLPTQHIHYTALNRQDSLGAADSFYGAYAAPPGPVYGSPSPYPHHHHHGHGYPPPPPPPPPPFPSSDHQVMIELAFDKLVLRCSVEDPLEHIVWTRYPCPNEYFYGHGLPVAEGSVVHNPDLYDVRIVGEGGHTGSELLMKSPLDPGSSGLYVCEAWPHYQKEAGEYNGHYGPPKPVYPAFSDVFIIGGSELLEECYKHGPHYPKKSHLKKHYDDEFEEDEIPVKKISKSNGSKKSNQNVDAIRKPRNITRFENAFSSPEDDLKVVPRYNLRFENLTLQNTSASDFFRSASAFSHLFRKDNGFQFMRNLTFQLRNNSTQPSKSPFSIFKSNGFNNLNFVRNSTFQLFKKDGFLNSNPVHSTNKTSVNNSTKPKFATNSFLNDQNFDFKQNDQSHFGDSSSSSLFRKPSNNKFTFEDSQNAGSTITTNIIKKKDDGTLSFYPAEPVRNSDSLLSEAMIYTSQGDHQVLENDQVKSNSSKDIPSIMKFDYSGDENDSPWTVSVDSFATPQMSNNSLEINTSDRKSKVL